MNTLKILPGSVIPLMIFLAFSCSGNQQHDAEKPVEKSDADPGLHTQITGEWLRTDGSYVLNIQKFNDDSTLTTIYLNPKPIHIAETGWKVQEGFVYLFVRFDDEGYPGSYYSLGYLPEEDKLYGFYYQAVMDQEFEVLFERKP
jgi:hypothetical protein